MCLGKRAYIEKGVFYKNIRFLGQVFSKMPIFFCQILHVYITFINNYTRTLICFPLALLLLPPVSFSRRSELLSRARSLISHNSQLATPSLIAPRYQLLHQSPVPQLDLTIFFRFIIFKSDSNRNQK